MNYFNGSKTGEDEPFYTYNAKHMRFFERKSFKGGRVRSFNQYYKSKICNDVLKVLSRELKFEGNLYDTIEAYRKYKNDLLKSIKEQYESKFDDYRKKTKKKRNYISIKF